MKSGPKVKDFAKLCETTEEDVLSWANGMIDDPIESYAFEYPSPASRSQAIKDYMLYRLAEETR